MAFKLIDLFSGAVCLSLGFVDQRFGGGFESIWAVDNDRAAIDTYRANFGDHADCVDIEEWLGTDEAIPHADIVVGGPPCQGFSLLNKQRKGDDRRGLWEPFMDVVERSDARAFVIENVPGLLKSREFRGIQRRARQLQFEIHHGILNAADYGVPQTRKRAAIIGVRQVTDVKMPDFPPSPTHVAPGIASPLPSWVTVRDVLSDLPKPKGTEIQNIFPPLDLHFGRTPTPMSLQRYKLIPPGGNRFDLQRIAPKLTPKCWIKKTEGGTDLFGRLWWDRPSVTIRTEFFKPEKGRYLHPNQHRPITHREAARLMGFPDDFHFCGTKIEIAKQIGNAVPPPLAGALALWVREILVAQDECCVAIA